MKKVLVIAAIAIVVVVFTPAGWSEGGFKAAGWSWGSGKGDE